MTLVMEREARITQLEHEVQARVLLLKQVMPRRTVNIELLRQVVDWVWEQRKLPKAEREWDQAKWSRCVASAACRFGGARTLHSVGSHFVRLPYSGKVDGIPEAAQQLLGIDRAQASRLFKGHIGARRIRRVARSIARDAGLSLER
jgi:hypothetical protein